MLASSTTSIVFQSLFRRPVLGRGIGEVIPPGNGGSAGGPPARAPAAAGGAGFGGGSATRSCPPPGPLSLSLDVCAPWRSIVTRYVARSPSLSATKIPL